MRRGFVALDDGDLEEVFSRRGSLMRSVPRFLWGSFRVATKLALDEIVLPRMLLHKPARATIPKSKLLSATLFRRQRRRDAQTVRERRALRALQCVQMGELSAGRQALEGAELAPGNKETLRELNKRPARPRDPIPELPATVPAFNLSEKKFCQNVRSVRRGVAGGPSGMTADHDRPLLESARDTHLLFSVAELLAKGHVPIQVGHILRMGRMTALRKDGGGVRGIVAGEVIRRFTAKTIAQQLESVVNVATAPFQYALSTRAGCECIAHALQALTELDTDSTIMSIDGISAYDTMSRKAMLEGLEKVPGGSAVLPFVRLFYSSPSKYLWEDDEGVRHTIHQGEGGEQGDTLMPLLF